MHVPYSVSKLLQYSAFIYRRRVDDVTRNYGCTYSSKVCSFHWRQKILPDHCLSLQDAIVSLGFTMVAKEVKLMALAEGISIRQYMDDWLNENKLKTAMPREHPLVGSSCRKPRLDHKFLKIRFISCSSNRIFGYKFDLRVGPVFPTQKEIDCLLGKTVTMLKASHSSPGKLMSLWKHGFNGEDYTIGSFTT